MSTHCGIPSHALCNVFDARFHLEQLNRRKDSEMAFIARDSAQNPNETETIMKMLESARLCSDEITHETPVSSLNSNRNCKNWLISSAACTLYTYGALPNNERQLERRQQ